MLKLDRFSCSQKIQLKRDPPVTKFILPSMGDLNFSKLNYDNTCTYLDNKNTYSTETKKHMLDLMTFVRDRTICNLL